MLRFAGAALLAEIVLKHTGVDEVTHLHGHVCRALDRLDGVDEADVAAHVVLSGWQVVGALGYRPEVGSCVRCGDELECDVMGRFDHALGGVLCPECGTGAAGPRVGPGARRQLQWMTADHAQVAADEALSELRSHVRPHVQLLSDFVAYHVSGTGPMGSFSYFSSFLAAGS